MNENDTIVFIEETIFFQALCSRQSDALILIIKNTKTKYPF